MEDVNTTKRRRFSFCFCELRYSPLEFNFWEIANIWLNYYVKSWNKSDEVWNSANSLFGCRYLRRCLTSLANITLKFALLSIWPIPLNKLLDKYMKKYRKACMPSYVTPTGRVSMPTLDRQNTCILIIISSCWATIISFQIVPAYRL